MLHCSVFPFCCSALWSAVKDTAELQRWERRETRQGILIKSNPAMYELKVQLTKIFNISIWSGKFSTEQFMFPGHGGGCGGGCGGGGGGKHKIPW